MLNLRSLSLAIAVWCSGCRESLEPTPPTEVPEIGNFEKLAPYDPSLPTVSMPAKLAGAKKPKPHSVESGAINFEWITPDINPPLPLLIVEVIHITKAREEQVFSALMLWDQPTENTLQSRVYRGQLNLTEQVDRHVIRIRDPNVVYSEVDVHVS